MLPQSIPGEVWAVGGLVWTGRGQPQHRAKYTVQALHGYPWSVHTVTLRGEIHGLSTRNPATEPSLRLEHQYVCTKTVEIPHSYGGNLRHGENSALGLF